MLFVNIKNAGAFFRRIEECRGNVAYLDAQGARRDLKKAASELLHADFLPKPAIPELEVFAEDPRDRERLLRFMMEARTA